MHRVPRLKPGLGRHCAEAQRAKRLATSGCPLGNAVPSPCFSMEHHRVSTAPSTTLAAHQIYIHLAWTTRDRQPVIDRATRDFLGDYFRRTAIREHADVVVLAILRTHVHLLVRTAPRIDIPRLVQFLKGGSSYAASRLPGNILGLRWSREYSATMVSPKQLAGSIRYIEEQASHHPGEGVEGAERRAGKVDR